MDKELREGGKYSSFTLIDVTPCPDYNGTGYLFRHDRTGFEVYFFSTDDSECFFSYNVYTPPEDDTGVFHILEHTVLTGSRRYPVRDPFMDMDRNSVNTFLNAMTGADRTYYPAASPVKKDFDNIFSVYTDAVFDPLLRRESFMQEGIRPGRDGFEGVVFSEMKGDVSSHSSVVFNTLNRYLFSSSSPYRFESGGDPRSIPDLTYEKFLEVYRKYYTPANMTLFLYGNLDVEEKLEFLEREYLSHREGGKRAERPEAEKRWTEPRFVKETSDAEEGEEGASVMMSWLLGPTSDPLLNTTLSIVVDVLLGNPGCPLYKALIDSGVGRDIADEGGMNESYSSLVFATGFTGVDEKDAEKAGEVILESLRNIVEKGIDPMLVEATLRSIEFRLQEIKEGTPNGSRIFFSRIDKGWAYGRNPSTMLNPRSEIASIRREIEKNERYLEEWIGKNILENPHRLLSLVVMDENKARETERIIEEKRKSYAPHFTEEMERKFIEFEESEDSPEEKATLPRLSLSDIPKAMTTIPREERDGILLSPMATNGIIYADAAFDCSDFTIEELEYCSLLTRLLTMTNVGELSYSEFLTRLRFSSGGFSALLETGMTTEGKERDSLIIRFKSLSEYYGETLSLVEKLLTEGDFSSPERLRAALRDIQSDYEGGIQRDGHLFALSSASRFFSPSLYSAEKTQGISFWFRVNEMLSSDINELAAKVKALQEKLFVQKRLVCHIVADKKDGEDAAAVTSSFISRLSEGEAAETVSRKMKAGSKRLAYTLSTSVNYTSLVFKSPPAEDGDTAAMRVFLSLLSRSSLWALEREKGGAYGAGSSLDINEEICLFCTYRDPRLESSIDDYRHAVEEETVTDEKLEDTLLRALSKDLRPTGPQSRGIVDLRRYLYGITDDLRLRLRDAMLSVRTDDLERARGRVLALMDEGSAVTVISSSKSARESSEKFRIIKLPFNNK